MADEADITQDRMEREMALRALFHAVDEIQPKGICHWCDEPVEHPKKFCDRYCAEDWEADKKAGRNR